VLFQYLQEIIQLEVFWKPFDATGRNGMVSSAQRACKTVTNTAARERHVDHLHLLQTSVAEAVLAWKFTRIFVSVKADFAGQFLRQFGLQI